ncbi:hypothetical protein [Ensifer adhaerens]|uniref:hypothetical protein n=1 Tax=Ensifer adhaerens TaxID=106592 RepID=UPI00098FFA1C|nr:hypothetical protein [Ensifer adhaerens]
MSTGIFGLLSGSLPQRQPPQHHDWQGRSGAWWVTNVYSMFADFPPIPSVYVMVKRLADGSCSPIYIGQTDDLRRRMMEHAQDKLVTAYGLGARELHAHFLAKTSYDRFHVETDLRNGHYTPLNEQPSAAAIGGLFGLGALIRQKEQPKSFLGGLADYDYR